MKSLVIRKYKKPLLILIILVIAITICFMIANIDKDITYKDYVIYKGTTAKIEKYDSKVSINGFHPGINAYYIKGTISSKNNKEFTVITYDLYNKKNKKIGIAQTGIQKLEQNKKYKFKAMALLTEDKIKEIDHYKLKNITN